MEYWQLKQLQSLPLEMKIRRSRRKITEWYEAWDGDIYVSFSGGKDSTVLLDLVRSIYPGAVAVFADTGLEYPEIRDFVKQTENVVWVKPKMAFTQVLDKYGYPIISKQQAEYLHRMQNNPSEQTRNKCLNGVQPNGKKSAFRISDKWHYLVDAPFKIGSECCHVMKISPLRSYERKTGQHPFIGSTAAEGQARQQKYLQTGCNAFDMARPQSRPLGFWTEEDIWEYIKLKNLPYSKIYDMGYERTGCAFCAFGVHMEKGANRFQKMSRTHPQLYQYCMDKLGMAAVLDYIKVPHEANETGYAVRMKDGTQQFTMWEEEKK